MKKSILLLIIFTITCFLFTHTAHAQKRKSSKAKTVRVKSYTTKKGTRVKSHYRSKPGGRRAGMIIYPGKLPYYKESGVTAKSVWMV
ncbi:hypothetical protein ACFS6H_11735 [Terrimonas rubra]|uniref:Uncharacterized protein n=1 Tax=Terrimonas rubra TaxID=1035890 RepID=A0ABW6A8Z9_9BACT